jgi:hypothetical protein
MKTIIMKNIFIKDEEDSLLKQNPKKIRFFA